MVHSIVFYSHMCLRRNTLKPLSKDDLFYDDTVRVIRKPSITQAVLGKSYVGNKLRP
jgi:hypothetical protein